jgi:hypothetical protein
MIFLSFTQNNKTYFGEKDFKNNWLAIFIKPFCKLKKKTRKLKNKLLF